MTKYTLDEVNDMYVDVLKEVGNVGSGNAATAIANMVGTRIDMKVPNVKLMDVGKLGSAIGPEEETVIGIFLEVSHDIDGSMMFLLDLESGHYLADKLLMKENVVHEQMEVFDEMELSALKEVGNIITASYLSALASMTNLTILPSVPYICVDMAAAILSVPAIEFGLVGDRALLIETEICADVAIRGYFILMPEQESYYKILSALGLSL